MLIFKEMWAIIGKSDWTSKVSFNSTRQSGRIYLRFSIRLSDLFNFWIFFVAFFLGIGQGRMGDLLARSYLEIERTHNIDYTFLSCSRERRFLIQSARLLTRICFSGLPQGRVTTEK